MSALGVSTEVAKMYCVLVAKDSYDDYRKYYVVRALPALWPL